MTRHVRSGWPVAMAVGLVVAACGSDDSASTDTTTTIATTTVVGGVTTTTGAAGSSTSATPTTPVTEASTVPPVTRAQGPKVGEVVAIVPNGGRADDELVAPGTALRQGTLLAADPAGTVDFKLDRKIQRCQARPASQVRLVGSDDALLEFLQGTVWCGTTAGGSALFTVADEVLRADDPVFSVTVGEDGQVEVRVIQGFVQVQGGPTLGEGQRGNRGGTGESWSVGPFGMSELPSNDENDEGPVVERLLDEVVRGLPALGYPVPDPSRSPTLTRAADAGVLRVLVVATDDPGPVGFAEQLFGGLVATRWGLPVEVTATDEQDALAQLEAGEAGIVVAPGADGGYVPLFEDAQGQVWRAVADAQDGELTAALEGTLRTALQAFCDADSSGGAQRSAPEPSCYEQIYSSSIGGVPVPLGPFAGLLGLG